MNVFEQFIGQYPLTKCLGFKLEPTEETKNNSNLKKLIEADDKRDKDAKKVKEIIDRYHKQFIELCLKNFNLKLNSDGKNDSLEDYVELISNVKRTEVDKVKTNLRKQIVEALNNGGGYKDMFKKELIKTHLVNIAKTEDEKKMIKSFSEFTTYFEDFNKKRKNMYSDEAKSTAIAYRLINENLPIFYDNMRVFEKIAESEVSVHFAEIESTCKRNNRHFHLSDIFRLDYFTKVLIQKKIKYYNDIVGACNKYINNYNQQQKDRKSRLPQLKPLYKMILSDKVAISWLPEKIESDKEMIDAINEAINDLQSVLDGNNGKSLKYLLQHIGEYDLSRIYISNDSGLTDISQRMFGQYDVFTKAEKDDIRQHTTPTKKERANADLYEKRINKLFKLGKSFSIDYLNGISGETQTIEEYFASLKVYDKDNGQDVDMFSYIEEKREAAGDILAGKYTDLNKSDADIKLIKDLLDAFKILQRLAKPLLGNGDEADKDNEFYVKLHEAWDTLSIITPLYDKVRNWLTRKPYSTKKIKLHFENNGMVLTGWSDSKTAKSDNGTQYGGYLFRKKNSIDEYDYYLGISSDAKLFRTPCDEAERGKYNYERLDYYQLKSKTFYGKNYKGKYSEDKERMIAVIDRFIAESANDDLIKNVNEEKKKSKSKIGNPTGYINFLKDNNEILYESLLIDKDFLKENEMLINSIKGTLRSLSRFSKAKELANKEYSLFTEIMEDVERLCSEERIFKYFPISEKEMNDAVTRENKALFLFKISNKDLSYADTAITGKRKSRGRDNLHTMYFKALMSGTQNVFDIGSGEVFFRAKTQGLKTEPTHDANIPIRNKNKFTRKRKETSSFPYGLVKDKRYTEDSFQFHLSFTQNYAALPQYINPMVNEFLKTSTNTHIIGIDRGERNLLYLVMIDMEGNIKKQFSLNEIKNEIIKGDQKIPISTNYHDLLIERAKDNNDARKNWQTIESIKELKEGHLSQAIHKITKLMIENNAVIVLEDLNPGFIRSRQKREFQEYGKFERMLANKLQYLVDKKKDANEIGGVLNGFQLTNDIESNKKYQEELRYQNGFLFYVPAWNTSKIDPVTGFVNMLPLHEYRDDVCRFFEKFDTIRYNLEKDWFEFTFDYINFNKKVEGTQTKWTLCTYGERIETSRKNNQWNSEEVVLTDEFKKVFTEAGIDITGNLKEAICSLTEKKHLESLMHLMKLLLQMRNSKTGTEVDYILSPVADANGNFYDSRKNIATLPKDADANGAYNIARKGLWAIRKIQSTPSGEKPKLAISNKEWLQFAQQKPYLDE